MEQARDGKTVSRTRISFCSGVFYGCNSLHGRVRVYAVAKTFFMQPRQYHRGYPGLLHLVIAPAPRKPKYPTGTAGLNLLDSSQHNIF